MFLKSLSPVLQKQISQMSEDPVKIKESISKKIPDEEILKSELLNNTKKEMSYESETSNITTIPKVALKKVGRF